MTFCGHLAGSRFCLSTQHNQGQQANRDRASIFVVGMAAGIRLSKDGELGGAAVPATGVKSGEQRDGGSKTTG